jgi:hypothetical protein
MLAEFNRSQKTGMTICAMCLLFCLLFAITAKPDREYIPINGTYTVTVTCDTTKAKAGADTAANGTATVSKVWDTSDAIFKGNITAITGWIRMSLPNRRRIGTDSLHATVGADTGYIVLKTREDWTHYWVTICSVKDVTLPCSLRVAIPSNTGGVDSLLRNEFVVVAGIKDTLNGWPDSSWLYRIDYNLKGSR